MSSLVKLIAILLSFYVLPSKGNIESEVPPAMSCEYTYDTQPAQRALSCNILTAVLLKCQVSSERNDFSISWHYSTSAPESTNINMSRYVHGFSNGIITTEENVTHSTTSLTSELTISEFSESDNGFYWCSVDSNGTTLPNPSVVLHILHHTNCAITIKEETNECHGEIRFYSPSSIITRCAEHNVSLNIIEAQNCNEKQSNLVTTTPTQITIASDVQTSHPQTTNGSGVQSTPNEEASTVTNLSTLPQILGITIGASMGGLVLALSIVIIILLVCLVRMRVTHQERGQRDDSSSPHHYDDIHAHTCTSIPLTDKDKMSTSRISKMPLELNVSYECICPQAISSQANDNVYDYVQ